MKEEDRTLEQLEELAELRQRIAELEKSEAERKLSENKLRESQEKLRTVADFTYDWEYWIGAEANFVYVSPSCERITGYRSDEFERNPGLLQAITHPDDRERFANHLDGESEPEGALYLDFRIINRKGEARWIAHICQPAYGSDGRYLGRRASNSDITERKLAEAALRVSEERCRRITEAITDYIFSVRVENGRPVQTTHGPACETVTGYTADEFNADPFLWIRMVPEEDQDTVKEQAANVLSGKHPQPIEHRIIRKEGRICWVSNSLVPYYDVNGQLTSYDGVIRDITERKRSEEALRESEERYRQLVETMNEGLALADENYLFTYVNERLCEMLGYSRDEMIGRTIVEFVHEDHKDLMHEQMARRRRGEAQRYEVVWRAKNGRTIHTLISPKGFYNAQGHLTGSLGVVTDITHRKQAEDALRRAHDELELRVEERTAELLEANQHLVREIEERTRAEGALRESEAKYRLLIGNLPSIVYRGYRDWSVDFMDEKIEILTGYKLEDFDSRKKKWSEIILDEDFATAREAIVRALKTDRSFIREYRIRTANGGILWIQDRGHIVCDQEGQIDYVSGVFFDVTERKRLQSALVQKEKLNTLGAIAAEVAHQIRNPLVAIGGFALRLQQRFPNLHECDVILQESKRLEEILSRVRNYLKPVEIRPQECSVNTVIAECVDLLSPETERREVLYQLDLDPGLPVVYLDPDILSQIFINLILNAFEAMDRGGILAIKTSESDRELFVEFRNQAAVEKFRDPELLFMPFDEGGESIGLPFCYRQLKDMDGLLSFSQEKDYMILTASLPKTGRPRTEKGESRDEQH
ncbi:MAG: PAS domain S-box protein [Deltaproteobacteria bacterium]|nr:MAG: PAS domain S-box protein [Deltaproteobacteria bacterium]